MIIISNTKPFWLIDPFIRRIVRLSVYLIILGFFIPIIFNFILPTSVHAKGPTAWVADELLVGFRAGVPRDKGKAIYKAHGAAFIDEIPRIKTHIIRVPSHALEKIQRALSHRPEVEYVEKNVILAPDLVPNDPYYPSQWHLPKILALQAWEITKGSSDVIIAILDSGVDSNHPDLAAKIIDGYNFCDDNADTSDVYGHGTAVAGAAAALSNNGTGVAAPACESLIMPIRVSDTSGYANITTISRGLIWAVDHGARVMNLSFGGVAASSTIRNAAQYVVNNGGLVVAAAGNCACLDGTAETPYIISVSATDRYDNLALFSSRGEYVDVSAPGQSILSTLRGGSYSSVSGTSFASPVTAGIIALMWSVNPDLTWVGIRDLLEGTAVDLGIPGYDTSFGFGRVNAYEAVLAAIDATDPSDSTPPSVSISSPMDGAAVSGIVGVNVSASDNVGVTEIELYIDDVLFATDVTEPFVFTWDTTLSSNATHTLHAVAYDAAGNSNASGFRSLTVDNSKSDVTPPNVSISAPADGATVSGTVFVEVAASDDVGVFAVELYINGFLFRMDSAEPFVFTWDTTQYSNGIQKLQAVAYDAAGNSTASVIHSLTVDNYITDVTPPNVFISEPAYGTTVSGTFNIDVSASDDVGVFAVELYINDLLFRMDSTEPFAFAWDTTQTADGVYKIQAKAYDSAGNVAVSASRNLTVQNIHIKAETLPPEVSILSPYDESTHSKPVKIEVEAADDQRVVDLELFLDGIIFQSASCGESSCSLRFSWNIKQAKKGWHTLSAIAYDDDGNIGKSNQVAVNVK